MPSSSSTCQNRIDRNNPLDLKGLPPAPNTLGAVSPGHRAGSGLKQFTLIVE
jgi:hypothetical protein